ncbi:hypothetical protein VNI00_009018 [Paramarasmius palmivorus]|uniref:BTB domain-containing protein n=1 Tax=Paramarasmius palmivorus TaxID=297713 RepID=A0AAW0CP19_9AGAR
MGYNTSSGSCPGKSRTRDLIQFFAWAYTPPSPVAGCVIPIDVIIKSSDNHTFGAHAKNLEWFTEGFPLSGSVKTNDQEVVQLTETADVLKLFLAFTHNNSSPDLSGYSMDVILGLAEAADKYGNHFAMTACKKFMWLLANGSAQNALHILKFKAVHGDNEDIDDIAELTMGFAIVDVVKFFGDHFIEFRTWLLYQQAYDERVKQYDNAVNNHFPSFHRTGYASSECPNSDPFRKQLIRSTLEFSKARLPAPELFQSAVDVTKPSVNCICGLEQWLKPVKEKLENRPKWSDYVARSSS